MRTWLTLGALVGAAACHPTVEVPTPQLTPDSTVIFLQPALQRASWTTVDSEQKLAAPLQLFDPDEPWHALTYHCTPDVLEMPMTLKVETNLENKPMLPNSLATLMPGGAWTDVAAPYEALADDIQDLNWEAPEVCAARVGDVSYRTPPIPPGTLDDLAAFFSLGEDQEVFVAARAGAAYTIDKTARVTKIEGLPGPIVSGYLGADDGQFYLLTRSGEVFQSNLNFETTRIAGGANLVGTQSITGGYGNNQIFGSPDGRELMVLTSSGTYVYDGDDEWTTVRTTTIADFIDAVWIAPGEFLVFGGEAQQHRLHHMRRDGTFVRTWLTLGDPGRFTKLGERIFLSSAGGRIFEYSDGDWEQVFNEGQLALPIREPSTGGLIVASIDIGFLLRANSRFGVYHSELDRLCKESSDESRIDGAVLAVAPVGPGVDAFVSFRLKRTGLEAPVVRIRTQNVPPRACGYELRD